MSYSVTVSNNNISISLDKVDYGVSLSRTGGQGAKGASWTDTFASADDQAVPIYSEDDSEWQSHRLTTSNLSDIDNTNRADGSILVYSADSSKYVATNDLGTTTGTLTLVGGTF